jgi:hypothetical protein
MEAFAGARNSRRSFELHEAKAACVATVSSKCTKEMGLSPQKSRITSLSFGVFSKMVSKSFEILPH